jgi:DNA-binding CsgD family transcriptional regulator
VIADVSPAGNLLVDTSGSLGHRPGDASGAGPHLPEHVVVQGPGGTGKTALLAELADRYRRSGMTVVQAGRLPELVPDATGLAVLLDDAHRMSEHTAHHVRRLLTDPGVRVAVAHRPWPRPPALADLVHDLGSERRSVVLGHVDREQVRAWAVELLGPDATADLVDAVLEQTGGLPALVHPLLRCLVRLPPETRTGAATDDRGVPRLVVPAEVVDVVRSNLAALDEDAQALLHAVAAGAPLDPSLLAPVLDLPEHRASSLVAQVRATGLLLASGRTVPLARAVLLGTTPRDVTRSVRRRLLHLLVDRGDEPVSLARTLAGDGVRDRTAADLLERHGRSAMAADPALAEQLLGAAVASGASVAGLGARRAQAAALAGNFDAALQAADAVLSDPEAPDQPRAAGVTAVVLAHRGLMTRSAQLFLLAGPTRAGAAALALLSTGSRAEAAALLDAEGRLPAAGAPTILAGCEELTAHGVLRSLQPGPDSGADIVASLSTLMRAAAMLEPIGRGALLLDTPAALAALVAVHCGELGVAESVLHRALAADVGGAASRRRHLLLLAWVAMLRGRMEQAQEYVARAVETGSHGLEPRDDLFRQALAVGLCRRSGDLAGLVEAWARAREAVLRHPIDLFSLLPLGELMVAAARLDDGDRLAPTVADAQAILARLDHPALWGTPLHWSGAQAAILADDAAALKSHAVALVQAARTSPYAATLARAGRCWLRVLTDDIDSAGVDSAARELAAVGLVWDGARLIGQAAARTRDAQVRTTLLSCARALTDAKDPGGVPQAAPPTAAHKTGPGGRLSGREQDVAELVVAGQTYRQIGEQLFISAKTVEHHVARIRHRLGATSRSDLVARLRAELPDGG